MPVGQWGFAWNVLLQDMLGFELGASSLAALMCGNPNAFSLNWCWGIGWLALFGVSADSEVMAVGFSNGAGLAVYMNAAYSVVTAAVSIDYHGYSNFESWVPVVKYTGGFTSFGLHAYSNCASKFYSTDAIVPVADMTLGEAADLTNDPVTIKDYGGWGYGYQPFVEYSWSSPSGKFLKFAVHGMNVASEECTDNVIAYGEPMLVHMAMPYFAGWLEDVLAWVSTDGTPPPLPPSPPPSPPAPPSPAPPPFPPASSWFMGIKPIKTPTPVKPSDTMSSAEVSLAEKNFYNNQYSKTFNLKSGGTIGIEAKPSYEKIMVCSDAPDRLKASDEMEKRRKLAASKKMAASKKRKLMDIRMDMGDSMYMEEPTLSDADVAYVTKVQEENPFMVDVKSSKILEPVEYIDDYLYRSYSGGLVSTQPVKIDVENLLIQEKELYADIGLWQEVEGDPTAEKVPTFYFSSAFLEPGYVMPTVPPVPSPPPLSTCKSKLVEIDVKGSSASMSLTKLEILKVKLDSPLGARRPIENLDASTWTKTGASYSIGAPTSLVSMSDKESLKESASEVEKFLQESTAIGSGTGSKSIEGALKIA